MEGEFAGTGQITTFNQLGFGDHVLKNHKPDGWYLPSDPAVAIILETKSEKEDVTHQAWIDELLKNCAVVMTRYHNVIGILSAKLREYSTRGIRMEVNHTPYSS